MIDTLALNNVGFVSLSNEDTYSVNGGIGFLAFVGAVAAVVGLVYLCYEVGKAVGETISALSH